MSRLRLRAPMGLAGIFTLTGILHFVRPAFFDALMPRVLPSRLHRPLIYGSGVAELACAYGLARRARWAGPASTAVLMAVWPANLQMALDSGSGRHPGAMDSPLVAWSRMPFQIPMLWAAHQATLAARRNDGSGYDTAGHDSPVHLA